MSPSLYEDLQKLKSILLKPIGIAFVAIPFVALLSAKFLSADLRLISAIGFVLFSLRLCLFLLILNEVASSFGFRNIRLKDSSTLVIGVMVDIFVAGLILALAFAMLAIGFARIFPMDLPDTSVPWIAGLLAFFVSLGSGYLLSAAFVRAWIVQKPRFGNAFQTLRFAINNFTAVIDILLILGLCGFVGIYGTQFLNIKMNGSLKTFGNPIIPFAMLWSIIRLFRLYKSEELHLGAAGTGT